MYDQLLTYLMNYQLLTYLTFKDGFVPIISMSLDGIISMSLDGIILEDFFFVAFYICLMA